MCACLVACVFCANMMPKVHAARATNMQHVFVSACFMYLMYATCTHTVCVVGTQNARTRQACACFCVFRLLVWLSQGYLQTKCCMHVVRIQRAFSVCFCRTGIVSCVAHGFCLRLHACCMHILYSDAFHMRTTCVRNACNRRTSRMRHEVSCGTLKPHAVLFV